MGPTVIPHPDHESSNDMNASLEVSGNVVLLMVKGLPTKTVFWSCRIEITGTVED
jgi:hypothetical protein